MKIINENITVVMGIVTSKKVLDTLKGTWNAEITNTIEETFTKLEDDLYEAELYENVKIVATVTKLTESGSYSQITTFAVTP